MNATKQTNPRRDRWSIGLASDFLVVGYNPENADLGRPRGEIVREVFHLEATNDFGDRRVWGLGWEDAAAAERAIALAPAVETWQDSYPVYGSDAYVAYGEDEMQAWEARHQEWEEAFPLDRWARF